MSGESGPTSQVARDLQPPNRRDERHTERLLNSAGKLARQPASQPNKPTIAARVERRPSGKPVDGLVSAIHEQKCAMTNIDMIRVEEY